LKKNLGSNNASWKAKQIGKQSNSYKNKHMENKKGQQEADATKSGSYTHDKKVHSVFVAQNRAHN
jgi:hypothetical protein